jgi:hypothetical protein
MQLALLAHVAGTGPSPYPVSRIPYKPIRKAAKSQGQVSPAKAEGRGRRQG